MKCTAKTAALASAVAMAERIAGKKESLPILSCILIDVDSQLRIRATNLESGIEASVPADIAEKGTVAVPATILSQTIRTITADAVTLSVEEGNLLVASKGSKTLLKAIPHTEFPALPLPSDEAGISIKRDDLLAGIRSVIYAASPSMIRPDLGSISISIESGRIVFVATDSFRLAEKTVTSSGIKGERDLLLPLRHAGELVHVFERVGDETVSFVAEDAQVCVSAGGVRYVSRIVDATFPNYKEIIPKSAATEATILKGDLADAFKKARIFAGNDQHVGLHVYPKKKICTITAQSNAVGEMSDTVDAAMNGDDLDINFHIGYLADCLGSVAADSIVLKFAGPGRPLVMQGVSDASFLYLVMPLNR